ncbi:MAG: glycosyltransferase family 4 protein [Tannerella sp.]|jgi:glycosyltransferase involved in cell wall biosynthesis|nr:glycosyltransferase family 4 protein [Tannerella sp.]
MDKKKQMSIFVIGTRGIPDIQGGVERHCENMYPYLSEYYNITIFRRKPYVRDHLKIWHNIRFIDLTSTKIKGFETVFHSLLTSLVCIVRRPDIVHVHNIGPGMFTPLLRLFGLKVVITYHSPNYEHAKWNRWQKMILRFSEYCALKFANKLIFVSRVQYRKFSSKYAYKAVWIPNGVKSPVFSISTDYIHSLGLTEEKYILSVGRITQEKGFDYLIEAYKQMKDNDFRLVIAGGEDHHSAYSKQIVKQAHDNHVILTGFITGEPLYQLYSHAGLFVLPSYNEGHPIALLEAMNYNIPVIVSDIPANKEIGLDDEVYFQTGNVGELTIKMHQQIAALPRKKQYEMSQYNWEIIANQTVDVYHRLFANTV